MKSDPFLKAGQSLKRELHRAFGLTEKKFDAKRFDALALKLFAHQYAYLEPYRNLCKARGVSAASIAGFRDIPAVPTSAFKQVKLLCGPATEPAHVFTTSGTSLGDRKGNAYFSTHGLGLMERSILVNAGRMLFPDVKRMHILVLAPSPAAAPQMIMAWGMEKLIEHFGTPKSRFLVGTDGLNVPALLTLLEEFVKRNEPVCLIGASFGFVNLLEGFEAKGISLALPTGSRTMDAGGYKGRSRELTRTELEERLCERFGIAPGRTVNLLGMTELASQFYDDTLAAGKSGAGVTGLKQNPPWTRTRAVDPLSLADVPMGTEGVLLHLDLANLDTPFAVLTDDLGVVTPDGFSILGRLSDDDSRGCSLTVDELTRSRI